MISKHPKPYELRKQISKLRINNLNTKYSLQKKKKNINNNEFNQKNKKHGHITVIKKKNFIKPNKYNRKGIGSNYKYFFLHFFIFKF